MQRSIANGSDYRKPRPGDENNSSRAAFDELPASNQRLLFLANPSAWTVILYPMVDEARVFIRFARRYTIFDECCILIISSRFKWDLR